MPHFVLHCLALACSALVATAFAQQAPVLAAQTPAQDATPASAYRSAWSGYRPFADEKLISWKDANDEVLRIGGWRAYLRESQSGPSSGSEGVARPAPATRALPKERSSSSDAAHHHGAHGASGQSR